MKALILAAGRGTRLHPLTEYIAKPMLPLHGKPLMEWIMLTLSGYGIREFVVAVSHLAEQIETYFVRGDRWNVTINYSRGAAPAGKAGEIWRAQNLLPAGKEPFLVVPADTVSHLDYREMLDFHREHGGPATIAFSTRYRLEVGTAELGPDSRVKKFFEKENLGRPVSTGTYVLDGRIFPYIEKLAPGKNEVDLPGDVFPRLITKGVPLYGFVRDYPWWDVGRISDYEGLINLPPAELAQILAWGQGEKNQ
ncbi:nucleotidyltransferase family protein [Desulfotomaculum copahuensis]|uniref:Nucleotidyl transferase domain-containing protein n=1 Tax=Desulfotomaculum copahuensis TaxID=1838280 RepID=A0A1B7LCR1_9FIRM|nr:nucleotidyltransferase family protein [Desulfotomaculum copahuensis]OAT80713.1 hypothetical protein A6M21_12690 [Desulfotomaculum copahuensis]